MRLCSEILDSCLGSNQFRYIHLLPFPYKTPSSLQLASYHNTLLHCLTHKTTIWTAYIVLYQTEAVTLSFTYTTYNWLVTPCYTYKAGENPLLKIWRTLCWRFLNNMPLVGVVYAGIAVRAFVAVRVRNGVDTVFRMIGPRQIRRKISGVCFTSVGEP